MKKKQIKIMAYLIIMLVISIFLIEVSARNNGITNVSTTGCTCHSTSQSGDVTVTLTGLPSEYDPDTNYTLTVTITGGPAPSGSNQGGFNLKATAGVLSVPSGATDIKIITGEATHTAAGNDQRSWDINWTAPGESAGDVTFTYAGNSVNGDGTTSGDKWNKGTQIINENLPDDTTKPSITITSPFEGQSFPPETISVIVSGTASDNVQVAVVEVSTDGSTWKTATGTTDWSTTISVTEGENEIYARAKDPSDNNRTDLVNITVQSPPIDDQKPSIIITKPDEGQGFTAGTLSVEMQGTASDNTAVILVEVSNDNIIWTPALGLTNWNATIIVQTGLNTLYARATDEAANSRTEMVNITVESSTDDTEPPKIQITEPVDEEEFPEETTTVEVAGTASDNIGIDKVEVSTDKVNWVTANGKTNWNSSIKVQIGDNTIYARAFDEAGNSVIDSVNFSVKGDLDTTPPKLIIESPFEGEVFTFKTTEIAVTGTASDDGTVTVVKVSTDGINYEEATGEYNWLYTITVDPGEYEITVTAEDQNGNIATSYVNFTVLADTIFPTLIIESHSSGEKLPAGTVIIILTGSTEDNDDVVLVEVSIDNITWTLAEGTTSWSAEIDLITGENIIYVRATDTSENIIYKEIEIHVAEAEEKAEETSDDLVLISVVAIGIIIVILVLLLRFRKK